MYKDIKKSLQAFMLIQVLIAVLIAIVNFGNLDAIAKVANSSVVIGVGDYWYITSREQFLSCK